MELAALGLLLILAAIALVICLRDDLCANIRFGNAERMYILKVLARIRVKLQMMQRRMMLLRVIMLAVA
jgi:hypothetical protein